ncbi:MAG: diguanylate cyclase [Azonexus sp.]|jgi:diguanylate cyclase (GGDEF)-like protein/PAS domain S-box-containing protein|nr:diguanylate cyclase [Azonexus sp.]
MSAQPASKPAKPPVRRRLIGVYVAILAVAVVLFVLLLGEVYRQAELRAGLDAGNLAGLIEQRLSVTLRRVQSDLEYLAATIPIEALDPGADEQLRSQTRRLLALKAERFPEILGYRVVDATGLLRFYSQSGRSPINVDDREYFAALRDDRSIFVYFSEVLIGRTSRQPMLIVSVPLRDADGVFRGAVVAPLDLDYIRKKQDAAILGGRSLLFVRRADNGHLALSWPQMSAESQTLIEDEIAAPIAVSEQAGNVSLSGFDGIERLYAWRRISGYPFHVVAAIAPDDYLDRWRAVVGSFIVVALSLVLALSLLLSRLLRAEREATATSARIAESEARYRLLADNSYDVIWTLDIASRQLTYVSPSVTALRDYQPQEVVGQKLEQWLTADSVSRLDGVIEQHLKRIAAGDHSAQVATCELEQLCRNGDSVPTEVVVSYLLDSEGVPRLLLGISRDVRERKRAEQALRESNRQLRLRLDEIGRLQLALQEQAVRDGLTDLFNRRYLDDMLEREVSRVRREGTPLALVMIDIDHFKVINDTYGHQAGDQVLRVLAATLRADIRAEDIACRYGGEEILILLPNMPLFAAVERAENWRREVEALAVTHGEFAIAFTISLGVSAYPEHGKTTDELVRCADLALYRAKAAGRNRTLAYVD